MADLTMQIDWSGQRLHLRASGALWWPEAGTLLVADLHIGKAASFRRLGVPVPRGTTEATLHALSGDVAATGARQVLFLGDLLHAASGRAPATLAALSRWRDAHPALQLVLVRGNHDDRAGDPPAELDIRVVDEPFAWQGLDMCHHPQPAAGRAVLAGHWHPCVTLTGAARDRLRLPCFWFGDPAAHAVGVLPAYGAFTGGHPIARRPGDRVFAIAGDTVREVPPR